MFSEEHLYAIALRRCNLIGDINFYKLVKSVGSAKEVWGFSKKELAKILGIGNKITKEIGSLEHLKFAENEIRFCEKNNIEIKLRHQNELPRMLSECEDAPAILYMKGNFNPQLKSVSIVGTRNMTDYGKSFVDEFLMQIPKGKTQTVSGLALGVDTEVHQQSVKNQIPTIAVLAHGFHLLYPAKNRKLSEKILEENGVLMTEFNSSQKPDRENFIQRNRIVAGISGTTIVVETAFGGGSMSTANFANGYNRDVFALPGKISDKHSQGCNQLIYQNKAMAISTIADLLKELDLEKTDGKMEALFPTSEINVILSEKQQLIYNVISENPTISLDELSEKTGIASYKILPEILELELLGKIKTHSGRQFSAI